METYFKVKLFFEYLFPLGFLALIFVIYLLGRFEDYLKGKDK